MNTTTYAKAKDALALVQGFSPKAQIIFDPSVPPAGGFPGAGTLDPATGVTVYPVPADTKDDAEGAYMIYGKVDQPNLAVPPSAQQPASPKAKPGEKVTGYTLAPTVEGTFEENVAALNAVAEDHKAKAAAGHPLYNNGIKFGENLVAMGELVMQDGTVNTNTVVALYWSSKPFNERQDA